MLIIPSYFGFCHLTELSVIVVRGADAITFLHQQLTQAVTDLDTETVKLGGICSPQGRLLATMYYYRQQDDIWLITSADIAANLIKRLSMFVLRAKVKIECLDHDYAILGLLGAETALLDILSDNVIDLFPKVNQTKFCKPGLLLHLPSAQDIWRLLWVVPKASLETITKQQLRNLQYLPMNAWNHLEVYTGIPRITLATQDKFVPQMINLEIVGGVNFKKGCYPGQEVVARSQYRGKVKRRLQMGCVQSATYPGMMLFHTDDPEQPCGMVVNAAAASEMEFDLLAEIKLLALNTGAIYLENNPTAVLKIMPLPYPIPEISSEL